MQARGVGGGVGDWGVLSFFLKNKPYLLYIYMRGFLLGFMIFNGLGGLLIELFVFGEFFFFFWGGG